MQHTPEERTAAVALAKRIDAKATDLLAPLRREMQVMAWGDDIRCIMWEVVARKAMAYAKGSPDAAKARK